MNKLILTIVSILVVIFVCSCSGEGTEAPTAVPTLSNDQLGTRAAETAFVNFTSEPTIAPSATAVKDTPAPTDTMTPIPPTATQAPTAIPTEAIFSSGQTVILDDFESLTGWYTGSSDNYLIEFSEGGYHVVVNMVTGTEPVYSIRQTTLGDLLTSIDIMRYDGKDGSYFGVVCRYSDPMNYYRFVLYTEGEFEIAKKEDGVFTSLIREELEKPLLSDGSPNNLRASCVGDKLELYVNEKLAGSVTDNVLTLGYIGIIAGTDIEPGLDVLFDNFIISQP